MAKTITIYTANIFVVVLILCISKVVGQHHPDYSCDVQPGQANTTTKLQRLRNLLNSNNLFAYVVFSEDEHQSEYVQPYDERRAWITGFTGSAGVAVVTRDRAALWTDGRYWTQAENQLDCQSWYLMRQGRLGIPTTTNWLLEEIENTTHPKRVGVAAQFVSSSWWSSVNNALSRVNASLAEVDELIDQIWLVPERPAAPSNDVRVHPLEYAGITWQEKVQKIVNLMRERKADALIVTALDEIAWLFSVRGSDIPYNPFFKAYAIVYSNQTTRLWMNSSQLTPDAQVQLNSVLIRSYQSFLDDLEVIGNSSNVAKVWFTSSASQAIFSRVPISKRLVASSPVELTKAIKNPIEQKGMRDCGIRDGIARVRHLTWLEKALDNNESINETQSAEKLEDFQRQEDLFQMLSFDSISAFGANAAIIHYSPQADTAAQITRDGLYLLDAGAQYLDCTTDVTRTHVFGTATEEQKKAYTLVLQGSIDLADAVFPAGTYGRNIDILARQSLYKNFMDYNHGTGHGIGHFLSVHEGPSSISMGYQSSDIPLQDGMVFSDEPGFYLPSYFGIRLETDVMVKNYTLPVNYVNTNTQFLYFEMLTWVPFERKLIICEMLSEDQKRWLNWYHGKVRTTLEGTNRLNADELRYLREKTEPIIC